MRADLTRQLRDAADSAYPYNTAMVPVHILRQAVLELSSTPAPQPAGSGESQRAGVTLTWGEAQAISDVPEVHEALGNFAHDPTEDNAVHVILAALQSKK